MSVCCNYKSIAQEGSYRHTLSLESQFQCAWPNTRFTLVIDPSTSKVTGQMITAMDFVGGVGYATTVNGLQISSLLKYTA